MRIPLINRAGRGRSQSSAADGRALDAADATGRAMLIQHMIDAVDALIVVVSPECRLWLWNARCGATSGVGFDEVSGQPLWSIMRLRPKQRAEAQTSFDRLISGAERSVEFQALWLRKDGRKARVSWTARLVDPGPGRCFVVATGLEVTRGRQAAREIAETESRFERLLEVLPDPVAIHQNGRIVFVNNAAIEMYGARNAEELQSAPIIERVAPEHRELVIGRMTRMLSSGNPEPLVEERHLKLDGTPFDSEVVATPVIFDGRPAVELVARDITARKQTEAALRASEARVRAVFDQSALPMVLGDDTGHVVEVNAAFLKLLGYAPGEVDRLSIPELTHPSDRDETVRLVRDLFEGRNDGFETEKRYIGKDGREIWGHVHVSAVREGAGPPRLSLATIEDITERRGLEDQLRQASKMEALGRLAGGVAHDFNNLLTVVNGYADLLVLSLEGDERAADALEIRKAGSRAAELTAQLLAFGRRSKRALEPVDLNHQIGTMVPMLRRLLGEDIEFVVKLDPTLGAVEADPSQFDQVVMNLVVNSRDAMPGGGTVTLTTSSLGAGGAVAWGSVNSWARLEIGDSGVGMDPEVVEHIFEPFFTTKGQGKGTGLGLATVYGVVHSMGGHVRVESTVGVGSRFIIELPLSGTPSAESLDHAPHLAQGDRFSETILLVEDEPAVRDFCKRALGAEGYRVLVAGPHDALEVAATIGTELDILVTDVVMPDFDGPTIAAALSSRQRNLKVLFMSGYPRDREGELTGAVAEGTVLAKPFTPRQLCDAVRRVLDHKPPLAD